MYKEYLPSAALWPYIESYWVFDSIVGEERTVRVLPDGCVDILLNCNEKSPNNALPPFCPYIVGTMTTFSDVTYHPIKMIGIRFKPGGITAFIRTPIHELTDQSIKMNLIETIFDQTQFQDTLTEKKNLLEMINYINFYLLRQLNNVNIPDKQIMTAVNLIKQNNGCLPVRELLNEVCLSQRQFERKFKSAIGITPKVFSSVIRFQNAHRLLQQQSEQSIFLTAIECGYYDHAHFIREYKRFTGNTPKQQ